MNKCEALLMRALPILESTVGGGIGTRYAHERDMLVAEVRAYLNDTSIGQHKDDPIVVNIFVVPPTAQAPNGDTLGGTGEVAGDVVCVEAERLVAAQVAGIRRGSDCGLCGDLGVMMAKKAAHTDKTRYEPCTGGSYGPCRAGAEQAERIAASSDNTQQRLMRDLVRSRVGDGGEK